MKDPKVKAKSLTEQLRAHIVESGHTPHALAAAAGVDHRQVSRLMLNQRDITLATASKLAGVLNLRLVEQVARRLPRQTKGDAE